MPTLDERLAEIKRFPDGSILCRLDQTEALNLLLDLAAERERLMAENERLREALERIVSGRYDGLEVDHRSASECRQIARAALASEPRA